MNALRPAAVLLGVLLLATACDDDDDPTQSGGSIIVVNQTALTFEGVIEGSQPAPQQIDITTSGGGALSGLTLTTTYLGSQPGGWLDAAISSTSTPTTLTVAPSIGDLSPGRYSAMLVLRASGATNSPRGILVTFTVIGGHIFRFTPPAGAPAVTSVSVRGSFNDWGETAMSKSGDTWTLPMDLDPGVYEYKFYINGNWPDNMCNDGEWGQPGADGWIDPASDGCNGGNAVIMISDQHLFRYRPPAAAPAITSVTVPGNFNGWDNTATDMELVGHTWIAEVDLAPNTYMYKFFINGAWPGNMCNDEILGHPEADFWIDPQADSCDGDGNAVITVE
ncbi:MAG TPA: hypothetical protein VK939_02730 [Longimicrobiales bacterium]|nr:hypothetical protein [Longimicrobiales bacterium]